MKTCAKSNNENINFIVINIENEKDIEKADIYKQQNKYIIGFVPEDIKIDIKKVKSVIEYDIYCRLERAGEN